MGDRRVNKEERITVRQNITVKDNNKSKAITSGVVRP